MTVVVDNTMAPQREGEEEEKSSEEEEEDLAKGGGDAENGIGVTEVDEDDDENDDAAEEDVKKKKKKHMKVAADAPWKDRMWEGACVRVACMAWVARLRRNNRPSRLWLS